MVDYEASESARQKTDHKRGDLGSCDQDEGLNRLGQS